MIWTILVLMSLTACTITVTPISKKSTKHQTVKHHHKATTKPAETKPVNSHLIVDSDWLVQYRQLEEEHGDYRLGDDSKVESVGDGKYKVTHAMMDHFRDLSQTPPHPTPPPK